jgi:hypothetical protein
VVIGVTLTAIGLIAAVVLRAWAPSKQVECAAHIRIIGSAIHAYNDKQNCLPASCITRGYATWAVQIAPFLNQDSQSEQALVRWDFALPYVAQQAKVREAQVWLYYCPARRRGPQLSSSGDEPRRGKLENLPGALGDYGCAPTSNLAEMSWNSSAADGALIVGEVLEREGDRVVAWKSRVKLADLQRGSSYTVFLGEKHVTPSGFGVAEAGDGSIYNGDNAPSFARIVDKDHRLARNPEDAYRSNFGSWHPGVCQFLMADSSLRVIANDIDPKVLQLLIPRRIPEVKE